MVIKKQEEFELQTLSVRYTKDGQEFEKEVGEEGRAWWVAIEQKWENITYVEFFETIYTESQLVRFNEIKSVKGNENTINEYVMHGKIGDALETMVLKKQNEELRQLLADLIEVMLMGGV